MTIERLPDWSGPVIETLSWSTSVDPARDGSGEERRVVRPAPRRDITFGVHVDPRVDLDLHASYGGDAVRWLPGATFPLSTGAGLTEIDVAAGPHLYGFDVGRSAIVISPDGTRQETEVTAITIAGTFSVFVSPAVDIEAGDQLVPAITARLAPALQMQRPSVSIRTGALSFVQTESARWPQPGGIDEFDLSTSLDPDIETITPASGAAEVEVFYRAPTAQNEGVGRRREEFDGGLGATYALDVDEITRAPISQAHDLMGRQEIWSMRRFLYRRRGRFSPCFVPAGHAIEFLGTRTDGATDFWAIADHGWVAGVPDARRAIVLHRTDGTRSYHTFSELADSSHGTLPVPDGESWILDPYPAVSSLDANDVLAVDWLVYARLSSDVFALQYSHALHASISLDWMPLQWPDTWPVP